MIRKWVAFLVFGACALPVMAQVQMTLKQLCLNELDEIHKVFDMGYAPKAWKKTYARWILKDQIQKAKQRIREAENFTIKEYHTILKDFFDATQDHHVSFMVLSTEGAYLPFQVKGVGNRYFLAFIDREKLSHSVFPFEVGDEVLRFDGKPVHEVVMALIAENSGGDTALTQKALGEMLLTRRSSGQGLSIPKGAITITIRPQTGEETSRQIQWEYIPETVDYEALENALKVSTDIVAAPMPFFSTSELFSAFSKVENDWFKQPDYLMTTTRFFEPTTDLAITQNPHQLGARKSFVPPLGQKIWQSPDDNPFHAYLFLTDDRRIIGYVRIPRYTFNAEEAATLASQGKTHTDCFAEIIAKFEDLADALVIDQVNNPGGSVFYLYSLVSLLINENAATPRHRMTILPKDAFFAQRWLTDTLEGISNDEDARTKLGNDMGGYPVSYQLALFLKDYFRFISEQWNQGKVLTDAYHIHGVDHINPYPSTRFTKPILLLVNELDFSGGDFFPAILQDNNRATVFGTQTAGAGGYVLQKMVNSLTGLFAIWYTGSIAERINQNPLENLGVKPDIEYAPTIEDLTHDFVGYKKAVLDAVNTILNQ